MIWLLAIQICTTPLVVECRYMHVGSFEDEEECHEVGKSWLKSEIVNAYTCKEERKWM